ncbi:MAG TPA: DUF3536 domain-containing protein [Gemmatimonadales bacterium]|nr:DUF3536 domain-containing protein [Gemmatimonadales bacterium]
MPSVIIHGHFYQPPREDPWLDAVEREPSAAPFHDWNERIERECYRAVAAARVPGPGGRIARLLNCYEWMSFNFGPTLLEWLEGAAPGTYRSIIEADRRSCERLGHGNAIAMPYHHAILPLSTRREKAIEVRWGIDDFTRRFGRKPEGMWLPETAVDTETLDVLAEAGIQFTVLAPHQVKQAPPHGLPGLVTTVGGRSIAVFVYDGPISHDVAFGPLVRDSDLWVKRLLAGVSAGATPSLVSVATDGETFGHHHRFAEMALASTIDQVRQTSGMTVENYASFLARNPAVHPVTLVEPSSWSCSHGVERWRSNCGCRLDGSVPPAQEWRAPLREALGWLAGELHARYDREAPAVIEHPAEALAGYGAVLGAGAEAVRAYGEQVARRSSDDAPVRAAELLEMERGAQRSLTSCAWFFDDIGRIEAVQVLKYAAWAIELAGDDAARLEEGFLTRLDAALSNVPGLGTGKEIYLAQARPPLAIEPRMAASLAVARRFAAGSGDGLGWRLDGPDERAVLVNRRTGDRSNWHLAIERSEFDVRVRASGARCPAPVTLRLADLAEAVRTAVYAAFRHAALQRWLDPVELAALGDGAGLAETLSSALTHTIDDLDGSYDDGLIERAMALTELLGQLGQPIPFDAQTKFYQRWGGNAEAPEQVRALAYRLGFASTD